MKLKLLTLLALITLLFNQCQKEPITAAFNAKDAFTEKAKQYVSGKMPEEDFAKLNWSKAIVYEKDGKYTNLKIPLEGNLPATDKAVYLKYDNNEFTGNYFSIEKPTAAPETITTFSLDNVYKCVVQLTPAKTIKSYQKYEYDRLVYDSRNGIRPNAAIRMFRVIWVDAAGQTLIWMSMLGAGQPGSGDPLSLQQLDNQRTLAYLSSDPSISNPAGGFGEIVEIEYDFEENRVGVDIDKYMKCFENIPDAGATYSIELFTDVPVDSKPELLLNWDDGSPGHTFVKMMKTNSAGTQSVKQIIGFYPKVGWLSVLGAPVTSVVKDDTHHEFNASIINNSVSTTQFQTLISKVKSLSQKNYDIDSYNCADFGLDVYNSILSSPLVIEKRHIPGQMAASQSSTPQGIYKKLKEIADSNSPNAQNVTIPIGSALVLNSHGPCQ